jgi:hypothetical protein
VREGVMCERDKAQIRLLLLLPCCRVGETKGGRGQGCARESSRGEGGGFAKLENGLQKKRR